MDKNEIKNQCITGELEEDTKMFKSIFKDDDTVVFRNFINEDNTIHACIIFMSPMVEKESINENLILPIMKSNKSKNTRDIKTIDFVMNKIIDINNAKEIASVEKAIKGLIDGKSLILFDGSYEGLLIDIKKVQTRGISEPESDTVIRGPREGFIESLETNISLIKRKINSLDLKFKYSEIGDTIKTKICICYMDNLVSHQILYELNRRLRNIKIDGVLESSYIEEYIKDHPFSIFRTVGHTERPDVVAGKLLEGRIAIICDGTPFVLTVPFLFIENFQSNEDYYENFIYGSLNRIIRIIGFFLATSTPAIYVALITFHQEIIPTKLFLSIAVDREQIPLPTILEAISMLFVFEVLRETASRLPKSIGPTVSIIGSLVLGDAAARANIVSPTMIIIVAITGITTFLIPKMNITIIVIRGILLVFSAILGIYGYMFGIIGLSLYIVYIKSFGVNYMTKMTSTGNDYLCDTVIRCPWWFKKNKDRMLIKKIRNKSGK